MGLHRRFVGFVAPDVEQPAVDFRMQRLHAAIEHFREAGVLADILDREARFAQGFGGAASGDQFHPRGDEGLGKWNQSGLVGNGEQRARELHHGDRQFAEAAGRVNRQNESG